MAAPTIPPRPSRTQQLAPNSANMDIPKIPPRPKRSIDRSVSPNRDTFARSPLNDPSFIHNGMKQRQRQEQDLPPRPPSVTLPSIGQEGNEYANLEEYTPDPAQTSNVAGDLPLHAPTASVPPTTAKSRIAAVTRTDSSQAAAAGFGKSQSLFPEEKSGKSESIRTGSSGGKTSRPASIYKEEEEHGIPEIGMQVPMYPNAGDVQAPTPSPMPPPSTGVGFFNNAALPTGRHHGRTKSGREIFHGPPGSYGLHGHGVIPNDEFERKWYEKHPEDLAKEKQGEYGPAIQVNRKDYHWAGDKLVQLVRQSPGIGMGASREAIGTPDEHVGYMASEEYASRMASPRPSSARPPSIHLPKDQATPSVESPLRKTSFPKDQQSRDPSQTIGQDNAMESEADDDVIHIDPPSRRGSKIGGGGYDPPTEDLGPRGGNTEEEAGWINERGYGVPILASDEVAHHPEAQYLQPAVSPELERSGTGDYTINDPEGVPSYLSGRKNLSRPSSRNASSTSLQRFASPTENERTGTPLENVKEYEPLFPEDEEHQPKPKPKTAADKLKRPDLARHHFPSQDVWEDTPHSLQLQTTVETPQAPEEPTTPGDVGSAKVFEKPEAEKSRKEDITKEDQQSFLPEHTKRFAKTGLNKAVMGDMATRPGMQQRFPSHDIWEDSPEHHHLVTTVSGPQTEETNEYADDVPAAEKPAASKPTIPARSAQAKEISPVDKKAPVNPERPKPQVPARPAKPSSRVSGEKVPTTSTATGAEPSSQPKAKPAVPARPAGSKIAALKAGFLNDLNSKLGMGPQAPKVKEPEPEEEAVERAPLSDARKGRAKGPQRRKPASSPSGAAATEATPAAAKAPTLAFAGVNTIWEINDSGALDVPAPRMSEQLKDTFKGVDIPSSATDKVAADLEPEEVSVAQSTDDLPKTASGSSIEPEPVSDATATAEDLQKQLSNDTTESTDSAVQTGQQDVEISNPDGTTDKMTTYLGARAPEEGTVVVKGDEVHVGDAGERNAAVQMTSDGGLADNLKQREDAEETA